MSQNSVEIVRQMLDEYERGDFQSALSRLAPEVEWEPDTPDGKIYRGHEGIVQFFTNWLGTWESYEVEQLELIDAGDKVVSVHRERARGKGSDVTVEQTFAGLYEVRNGLISRWRRYPSKTAALEAAGLHE